MAAAPAATAQRLTTWPYLALLLSAGLAVVEMWAGLVRYTVPPLPPSFAILAIATGGYVLALLGGRHQQSVTPSGVAAGLSSKVNDDRSRGGRDGAQWDRR